MVTLAFMQRLARWLRRYPWLVVFARHIWRFTRPRFTMGVVGVVINATGEVLMVEHVFHPFTPWGLPGGWVDRHEDPAATVRRELREELELDVQVGAVVAVEAVDDTHLDLAFVCTAQGSVGKLSYELLAYRWAAPDALPHTHAFHRRAIAQALALRPLGLTGNPE